MLLKVPPFGTATYLQLPKPVTVTNNEGLRISNVNQIHRLRYASLGMTGQSKTIDYFGGIWDFFVASD